MRSIFSKQKGQSLVETLIAVAVGTIFVIGAVTALIPALKGTTTARYTQSSVALGRALLENVRILGETRWQTIYELSKGSGNHYYLNTTTTPFTVASGDETVLLASSTYTRYFYVENVNRDSGGSIVTGSGTDDPSTQKVTVSYQGPQGQARTISAYLTRSGNVLTVQTNWSGGGGQDGPVTSSNSQFSTSSNVDVATTTGSIWISGF